MNDLVQSLTSEPENTDFITTPQTSQTRLHWQLTCSTVIICSILFLHSCCNGFILQKGDPTPFTTVTCKAFVNSDYASHFLNAPPVLLYQKIESLDNGSLHCVAKRAPNTRGLLCCQMSNDSIQKKWYCIVNPLSETCHNQCSAKLYLSTQNCAIHQGSKWLHYSSILCCLLLSKCCSCAPCSSPAQHIITSSLLFPLWSHMSSCGRTCQTQTMLRWYAFLVAYANKLTSAEHLYTNLCSLSHISILLHSPSSPPMPRYPTFHQMSLQWTRNNWRCMYACVFHI